MAAKMVEVNSPKIPIASSDKNIRFP